MRDQPRSVNPLTRGLLALASGALLLACDGDPADTPDATEDTQALDTMEDAAPEDVDDAAVADTTGAEDTALACEFPAPRLGDSAAAAALSASPERCGQADFTWLDDASLGEVVGLSHLLDMDAAALQALLDMQDVRPPAPLRFDVAVDQITYVTQDRGALLEATALIAYPRASAADEAFETLLLLHGSAGFADACAPSEDLTTAALGAALASMGFVTVLPDYIGLKAGGEPTGFLHPYLVGQPTAIASLDAVRAVGTLPPAQLGGTCPSPRVAVVGGSQGGHAALWVDRLAPYYAAELELVGTVATAPPSDLLGHTELALGELRQSTDNAMHFWGAAAPWYGEGDNLSDLFVAPFDTALPVAMAEDCRGDDGLPDVTAPSDIFAQGVIDAATAGTLASLTPWGCMVADNGVTSTSVTRINDDADSYGILFVLGEADTLVDPVIERPAFTTLCEQGLPMQYLECAGASHTQATLFALPEAVAFVRARFAGEPFTPTDACAPTPAVTCAGTPE